MFLTGYFGRAQVQQVGVVEQIGMTIFGLLVMVTLNGYLLATRGQTIGKVLTRIQIVEAASSRLLPFHRVYILRYLWTLPLLFMAAIIPSGIDDFMVNLIVIVDVLFIFEAAQRCLHDYIAGSKVVLYDPLRGKLNAAEV